MDVVEKLTLYQKNKEQIKKYITERRRTDEDFRTKQREIVRRIKSTPEYMEKSRQYGLDYYYRKKAEREMLNNNRVEV